jgi:hypothetical protein
MLHRRRLMAQRQGQEFFLGLAGAVRVAHSFAGDDWLLTAVRRLRRPAVRVNIADQHINVTG